MQNQKFDKIELLTRIRKDTCPLLMKKKTGDSIIFLGDLRTVHSDIFEEQITQ